MTYRSREAHLEEKLRETEKELVTCKEELFNARQELSEVAVIQRHRERALKVYVGVLTLTTTVLISTLTEHRVLTTFVVSMLVGIAFAIVALWGSLYR